MKLIEAVILAFTVVVLMCVPWLAPRHTLFGVHTGAAFRSTEPARQSLAFFLRCLTAMLALGLLILWLAPATAGLLISPLLAVAVFFWTFLHLNRRLKQFAEPPSSILQVDLTEEDRMPQSKWLSFGPISILAGTAIYLQQHWSHIPEHFPVHWGLDGQPDGWANRTFAGVYGIVILMAALVLWLILLNAVLWFGTRRSQFRQAIFNGTIVVEFTLAICPSYTVLSSLWGWPPLLGLVFILAPVAGLIIYTMSQAGKPSEPDDLTPESAWTGGVFYFNREDPVLAVPRRDGFGYAFNFARPTSWFLFLAPIAILLAWKSLF